MHAREGGGGCFMGDARKRTCKHVCSDVRDPLFGGMKVTTFAFGADALLRQRSFLVLITVGIDQITMI